MFLEARKRITQNKRKLDFILSFRHLAILGISMELEIDKWQMNTAIYIEQLSMNFSCFAWLGICTSSNIVRSKISHSWEWRREKNQLRIWYMEEEWRCKSKCITKLFLANGIGSSCRNNLNDIIVRNWVYPVCIYVWYALLTGIICVWLHFFLAFCSIISFVTRAYKVHTWTSLTRLFIN